jgi:NTP pyrophosphatase (non-canonical NTP hydrolase)
MTNSEKQILLICQEECAEVTQAISKVFRFGYDSVYNDRTNHQRLTEEVGDLLAMIDLMFENGIIDESATNMAATQKKIKLKKWSNIFDDTKELVN